MCTPYQDEYTLLTAKSFQANVSCVWEARIRQPNLSLRPPTAPGTSSSGAYPGPVTTPRPDYERGSSGSGSGRLDRYLTVGGGCWRASWPRINVLRVSMTPSRWKSLITSETASRDG